MKIVTTKKFVVVEADNGKDYQDQVNHYYQNPEYYGVVVDHRNRDNFCAFITYEEDVQIPETIKDQYELDGIKFNCSDCPYLERKDDKRIRLFKCRCEESGTQIAKRTDAACEFFYKALSEGTLMKGVME